MSKSLKKAPIDSRSADALFAESLHKTYVDTDRVFALLMCIQWVAGVATALTISPRTWIGDAAQVHLHVWAAVFLALRSARYRLCLPGNAPVKSSLATSLPRCRCCGRRY
ncbi:MAG: hypothetical protein QM811_28125 [Pirellulales bacterium]